MKKLMIFIVVGAVLAFIVNLLVDTGLFYQVQERGMRQCQKISGIAGAEDIALLPEGDALASSLNRHGTAPGSLYYLNGSGTPRRLPGNYPEDFFPHGIDVWQQDGETWAYVVNHRSQEDRIDVFRFNRAQMRLEYQPTMSLNVGKNINDISVIDKTRWLLTRDHRWAGFAGRMEDYLRLPLSSVLLVDEGRLHTLIDGLHFANGIYYDRQQGRLYVAETTRGEVSSWAWRLNDSAPALLGRFTGLHGVDNIMPDGDGLLVAAHPQLLKLAAYQKDAHARSPSMMWRMATGTKGEVKQATVLYQSHGEALAAISVAVPVGGKVMMGSVFDDGLLLCGRQ